MMKISEETQMYIDAMVNRDLPKEFDLFWDLKTREELYKEMCDHRRTLDGLEEMCDIHNIEYTNPLKIELNKLRQSKLRNEIFALAGVGALLGSLLFILVR